MVRIFFRHWWLSRTGFLVMALASCQSESPAVGASSSLPTTTVTLEARVLARHDSLMRFSDRLFDLRRRLTARRAELITDPVSRIRIQSRLDSATRATLRADDAMMDWMHAYHRPAVGTMPDSITAYFTRQLRALAAVSSLTRHALDSGAAALRVLPAASQTPSR
ncbi:MAG: hypothetical protein H7330_10340 [Hymenobacteraceae bacterium]|nr:hypothetical protein [Hymenobacteraceae bacterium]